MLWVQGGGDVGGHYGIVSRAIVAFQWGWLSGVFQMFSNMLASYCWICMVCTFVLMSLCGSCSLIDMFVNGRIVEGVIVLVSLSCIWGGLQLQFLDKICVYNRGNIV